MRASQTAWDLESAVVRPPTFETGGSGQRGALPDVDGLTARGMAPGQTLHRIKDEYFVAWRYSQRPLTSESQKEHQPALNEPNSDFAEDLTEKVKSTPHWNISVGSLDQFRLTNCCLYLLHRQED